ncbi:creatinine amidohydrolase [Saccharopolyspora erythraea NRRL 2338]|uniref:Creatininase n=2 Tax=Saccharopolyspora erythraea TaxID=1836 RepID=A4FCB6_SACEN|nr:mycofactocin biosynthesis peptidyl-dipeptidase MftE [Saccharopolyspora erythraea]EQD84987.1 creatininase [Saccharopolyspora erythraea D]PFG95453.1 creatinine amidohydrolase [Saccharopolyspora erythraea NRRL 2338]QRK92087.1 mycofactocin biosynthesis peptidyl-dipeptidase MftE [Saccharopolyspora erythraea]CAM01691.1 creatininase [Saccharopolyspora erythraea NRRL 2338]
MSLLLAEQAWPDLEGRRPLVIVPFGSCEQHGPHLPLDTDSSIATAVAWKGVRELADGTDVLLAPTQHYTASGEHEGFPGTVSIGCDALHLLVVELGRSLSGWCGRVLIVNGHGGNNAVLAKAVAQLRDERREVAWWPCAVQGGDAHAGRTETSMMMALRPLSVREDRARAGRTEPVRKLMGELERNSVRAVSPNGVLGDPGGASAAAGERLLNRMAAELCTAVHSWNVRAGRLLRTRTEVRS